MDKVDQKNSKSCPNAAVIRTGRAPKEGKLSEYRAHSDRASFHKRKAVRIPISFGQGKPSKKKSCPNTEHIRTGQASKKEKLSEYRSHSDKANLQKRKAVRMPSSVFGQGKPQKITKATNTAKTGSKKGADIYVKYNWCHWFRSHG